MNERLAQIVEDMSLVRKPRKKPVRHEDKLHLAVAKYLRAVIGREGVASREGVLWLSIEGRARRSLREGASNRARGCVAGFPDLLIINQGRVQGIELKTERGAVSSEQHALHTEMFRAGIGVWVCRSVQAVVDLLAAWETPTREAKR